MTKLCQVHIFYFYFSQLFLIPYNLQIFILLKTPSKALSYSPVILPSNLFFICSSLSLLVMLQVCIFLMFFLSFFFRNFLIFICIILPLFQEIRSRILKSCITKRQIKNIEAMTSNKSLKQMQLISIIIDLSKNLERTISPSLEFESINNLKRGVRSSRMNYSVVRNLYVKYMYFSTL